MTLLVMESKYILIMMDVVLRLIYFGGSGMFVRMMCCLHFSNRRVNLKFNGHINPTYL